MSNDYDDKWVSVEKPPTILEHASGLINGDRDEEYGHPGDDFARIANYWENYLGDRCPDGLDVADVAALMVLLKVARLSHNVDHYDSWADIAGYAGCWDRIARREAGIE